MESAGITAAIKLVQTLSDIAGRDANNGVLRGIVSGGPSEQLRSDHALLQKVEIAIQRLLDDIL